MKEKLVVSPFPCTTTVFEVVEIVKAYPFWALPCDRTSYNVECVPGVRKLWITDFLVQEPTHGQDLLRPSGVVFRS
jgi:hypothetical protein